MVFSDFITLFFLVAAMLIFLQLRSVLGRRTGNEKSPFNPYTPRDFDKALTSDDNKVVTLLKRGEVDEENRFTEADALSPVGSPLNASLRDVMTKDPSFCPKEFLAGARLAYEMIVMAFANGDRKALKELLSKEVFEGFDAAISERERRGEVINSTFVGIEKFDITHASFRGSEAQITLRIVSQLISATFDKEGKLVDGDPERVAEMDDIWTFLRDVRSRDPNWKLISTESDQ